MAINEPQEMVGLSVMIPASDKQFLEKLATDGGHVSLAGVVRRIIRHERERLMFDALADAETEAYLRSEAYLRTVR